MREKNHQEKKRAIPLAIQVFKKEGINAAINFLKTAAIQSNKTDLLPVWMTSLARKVAFEHPVAGLQIIEQVILENPSRSDALLVKTVIHDQLGQAAEAKAVAKQLIDSESAQPEDLIGASNLLSRFDDGDLALKAGKLGFERLNSPVNHASTLLYVALKCADWKFAETLISQLKEAYSDGVETFETPRTNLLWCDREEVNVHVVKAWSSRTFTSIKSASFDKAARRHSRIKIGYLSSDFRDHPTSRLINGLLRNHDRSQFEIILYDSGWDDQSEMRRALLQHGDEIKSVTHLSDSAAAELIRADAIDVLVELNGPTRANRMGILCYRPAPVQIDYLGWPGSVGGRVVDYVIGDEYTIPPGVEKFYPEKVIRIQHVYQVNDYAVKPLPPAPTRADVGLPEGVLVLGMFNAINKVRGEVWTVWMQILRAVPNAVLWILDPGVAARKHIAQFTKACGVDPKRIMAAPALKQDTHLVRLQCCDLMLDPWPYGGHTSTADALFAGVPVLALEGKNFAGRVSGALLRAAGLDALIQKDADAYVRMAVNLLRHPDELARIKRWVQEKAPKSDVFNAESKTRQLEAAYRFAFERACAGKPPKHLNLKVEGGSTQSPHTVSAPQSPSASSTTTAVPVTSADRRIPLVLVCGPWSSGTSAVAGMLANAGLQAPGPYVKVNDPRTSATYEMKAFQAVLRELASEQNLRKLTSPAEALQRLQQFRDETLRPAIEQTPDAPLVMLKHGLAPLFLSELCALFEVRIVGVLRPLEAIEATRVRRNWWPSLGQQGAEVLYRALFDHLVNADTPFHLVRYPQLLAAPAVEFDRLMAFCGIQPTQAQRQAALSFVDRPANRGKNKD